MNSWILALRPKTLTASIVPVTVGVTLAATWSKSEIKYWVVLFAILSSIFIQISTNLVNDALDFKKGADTKKRLGPVRVSASGLIKADDVLRGAFVAMLCATLFGVPLIIEGGWPILLVGIFSLVFAYLYTGGPLPLAYHGLGDFFVIVFFGWVAVGGAFYLQSGAFHNWALVSGFQMGALSTVLIAINNLRDSEEDAQNKKNTLAVRFGAKFVRWEIFALYLLSSLFLFYWKSQSFSFWYLPLFTTPLMIALVLKVFQTQPSQKYNGFLAQAALVHMLFGALLTLTFFLGRV